MDWLNSTRPAASVASGCGGSWRGNGQHPPATIPQVFPPSSRICAFQASHVVSCLCHRHPSSTLFKHWASGRVFPVFSYKAVSWCNTWLLLAKKSAWLACRPLHWRSFLAWGPRHPLQQHLAASFCSYWPVLDHRLLQPPFWGPWCSTRCSKKGLGQQRQIWGSRCRAA